MSRKLLFAVATVVAAVTMWSGRAAAHNCVGDWRIEQWQLAIDQPGAMWEPARPGLVDEPPCSTVHHQPAPAPAPAPGPEVPAGPQPWSTGPIADLIAVHFAGHPYVTVEQAQRIAWCESRHNPDARSGTSSASGLWQFLKGTWRWEASQFGFPTDLDYRFDAETSTALAALVMARDGGARQWLCKGR